MDITGKLVSKVSESHWEIPRFAQSFGERWLASRLEMSSRALDVRVTASLAQGGGGEILIFVASSAHIFFRTQNQYPVRDRVQGWESVCSGVLGIPS